MDLEGLILAFLPMLSQEAVQLTAEKLRECGVESMDHLKYIVEGDLMFLNQINRRMLLEKFKSNATAAPPQHVPGSSDLEAGAVTESIPIPWDAFPSELMKACRNETRPQKRDLNEMVRIVSDKIINVTRTPGRKVLREVAAEIVGQYPRTFQDTLNGAVIATGLETLLWKLENCINNKKRPSVAQQKQQADEEPSTKKPKVTRDSYGCVAWQPELPSGETVETQKKKKEMLQTECRLVSRNTSLVKRLMSQTYASQRALINGSTSILEVKTNWPFLFEEEHLCNHTATLLGFDASERFDERLEKVGKQIYRYAHTQIKKPGIKMCLKEIEVGRVTKKTTTLEYEAAPLLLLALLGERKDFFCKVTEETASDADLGDLPGSPIIIAKGESFLTANSFTLVIDGQAMLTTSNPGRAFKLMFLCHFALNLQYRKEISLTLEFTQRAIAAINPDRGTKVEKTKQKQHFLSPKVASLITVLEDYEI